MTAIVEQALAFWGMEGAVYHLVAERENRVFRIETMPCPVALRLHRVGYRSDAELASELAWMGVLNDGGLNVPTPVRNQNGAHLAVVAGVQVSVLSWLGGTPLADCLGGFDPKARCAVFHQMGEQMARLHSLSDAWRPDPSFRRVAWDIEGLLGETPLWGRFWENPALSKADKRLFLQVREGAVAHLTTIAKTLDFGLIHADMVPSNVLYDQTLRIIDFDDGGWGFRLFDVVTALLKHRQAPDYPAFESALLDGYRSIRALDTMQLDLFFCLRALTYVGWNIARMSETGGEARNSRFVKVARDLSEEVLTAGF